MQDGDGEDCEGSDGKEGDLEPSHHIEAAAEFAEKNNFKVCNCQFVSKFLLLTCSVRSW